MTKTKSRLRFNLKSKMLFLILSMTIIIFIIAISYIGISSRNTTYKLVQQDVNIIASRSALQIEKRLNSSMDVIRTLSQAFSTWEMWPDSLWKEYVQKMYLPIFKDNPQIYKLWDSWEKNMIDKDYTLPYGRYTNTYFRLDDKIKLSKVDRSIDGDPPLYAKIKKEASEAIWEPYWDVFTETGNSIFMTSMSVPITKEGNFVGIVAVDITMNEIQKIVNEIDLAYESSAFLISHEGILISHPDSSAIGEPISKIMSNFEIKYNLTEQIKNGNSFSFRSFDSKSKEDIYISFNPIIIGKTTTPWSVALSVPVHSITAEADHNLLITIIVAIIGLSLLTFLTYLIAVRISTPISKSTAMLKKIEKGDIQNIDEIYTNRLDEIGDMAKSLNAVAAGLNKTARFAEEIGNGNLESNFQPQSKKDVLGNSLIEMRASLLKARNEEDQHKKENEIQQWGTNGLAKFGEILRQDNDNLEKLSFNIIKNLVNYLKANQGTIFILNNQDKDNVFFELQAAIAYDRRHYMKKHIKIGEDLVGRSAFEKQSIYLADVPQDYIQITSGMGTANPNRLLIVPIQLNGVVLGVIEIASFKEIKSQEIEFVEKIGESIASTLNAVYVNQHTQQLLADSQRQREELSSQEEEMRQNLEELQATQEEATRREFELKSIINALSASSYTAEYDLAGTIIDVNEPYAKLVGLKRNQLIGMTHKNGYKFTSEDKEEYEKFWEDLRHGMIKHKTSKIENGKIELYLQETYTPIINEDNKPYKIIKTVFDITNSKITERNLQKARKNIDYLSQLTKEQENELQKLELTIQQQQAKIAKDKNTSQNNNVKLPSKGENLIEFTEDMATNIMEMDEQHKKIITILNDLFNKFSTGKKKQIIKENIHILTDYVAWHFNNEENYFDEFNYRYSSEHKAEHSKFLKTLDTLISSYEKSTKSLDLQWFANTKKWLESHFIEKDTQYAELFKSKGLK